MADRIEQPSGGAESPTTGAETGSEILTPGARDTTPSVLAVIIAHNPGDWFEETLESFANQDYQRLEVMVVDSAGDPSLAARVQSHLPEALASKVLIPECLTTAKTLIFAFGRNSRGHG